MAECCLQIEDNDSLGDSWIFQAICLIRNSPKFYRDFLKNSFLRIDIIFQLPFLCSSHNKPFFNF